MQFTTKERIYVSCKVLIIKEIVKQAIVNTWCHFIFILTYLCCLIDFFQYFFLSSLTFCIDQ